MNNVVYQILMGKNELSVEYLERKKDEIFFIIPELMAEERFEQKSSWHIYDVWKHTEVALSNSEFDYEERLALLLHDVGKPFSYQEEGEIRHFKGHAEKSAEISRFILEGLKYDADTVERIVFLIKNHSTSIDVTLVNNENIELFKKLLSIQYSDTKAYNPSKIFGALQKLDEVNEKIQMISSGIIN